MHHESDTVQGLAHAYGEKLVNERFTEAIATAVPENRDTLEKLRCACVCVCVCVCVSVCVCVCVCRSLACMLWGH